MLCVGTPNSEIGLRLWLCHRLRSVKAAVVCYYVHRTCTWFFMYIIPYCTSISSCGVALRKKIPSFCERLLAKEDNSALLWPTHHARIFVPQLMIYQLIVKKRWARFPSVYSSAIAVLQSKILFYVNTKSNCFSLLFFC